MKAKTAGIVFAALAAGGLIVWLIFGISRPHASVEARRCAAREAEIADFRPTDPPLPVADEPFVDGEDAGRSLADYRGKGVVLNFWATWCAPCVREMPALDRLQGMVGGDGIVVLALSEDRGGAEVVGTFYESRGIDNLPILIDRRGKVLRALGVKGLPTTLLIDAQGNELGRKIGAAEWDSPPTVAMIRRCLAPDGRAP